MKTLTKLTFAVTMLLASVALCNAQGYHYVRPYTDRNGYYHQPHYQTNPDGNPYNNWSHPGNVNPFTGEEGRSHTMPRGFGGGLNPDSVVNLDLD